MRQPFVPGVRRALRLGATEAAHAPATTAVHVAGPARAHADGRGIGYQQRCRRCGRVLAVVSHADIAALGGRARQTTDVRQRLAPRFFAEGRVIAEGPTSTYLVSDRPLAADEQECAFVPARAWE